MAPGGWEEFDDDLAPDWAYLTQADLDADLLECEETFAGAAVKSGAGGATLGEERLRLALLQRGGADAAAAFDAEVFFAAPRALQGLGAEVQDLLAEVDSLRFEAAALTASLLHGPLRPPGATGKWMGRPALEVFGLSGPPPRLPPLELTAPAAASGGLADYQRRLEELPRVLLRERRIRLCVGDVDKYQDRKDIGRDELVVNGLPVSGARGGYDAAVEAIAQGLAASSSSWRPEATQRAAELVLSVLNRTSSGFAAFEEVLRLFDCPDAVIVSPDSAAARPLEAAVLEGCALGRAHTRYAVRRADMAGDDTPLAVVDAEFAFRVPTKLLADLTERGEGSEAWPSEEVAATVRLRWS